ncbi:hypothetical protein AN958_10050 [Leucoagaricus sp. SymC.cos]|nr:hypothetical protein AN958_10050 [Leucoagaricus sp. SymC.cos]
MGSEREGGIKDVAGFWSWSDYDWHVYQDLREAKAASIGHALHWLGAMYLQFQSFADAFFECITSDDRTVSESLRGVLEQQDRRRWDSARRAIEWPSQNSQQQLSERLMEKKVQEHGQNVLVSHTLAHLADKIEQKQSSDILLNKRLELFLAINRGPRPDINADFPLVSNAYMKHFVLRERRLKFLKSILEMFTKDFRFNETHINAVKSILRLEYQENEFNAGVFTETINVLDGWINARGREPRDNTNLEVITRLKNHVSVLSRLRV